MELGRIYLVCYRDDQDLISTKSIRAITDTGALKKGDSRYGEKSVISIARSGKIVVWRNENRLRVEDFEDQLPKEPLRKDK